MSQNTVQQQETHQRQTDPNVLQRRASDPQSSSWVGASAGSGKTKVLTDRILRLMLPEKNGYSGTNPQKILALTFTKAGANEMALRIQERLSEWVTITDQDLESNLKNLLGYKATDGQKQIARKLFAEVVDTPGGLKIMTIHSFCQSILGRFPLEAGLSPNFLPIEEPQAKKLLRQSRDTVLRQAKNEKGSPLDEAIKHLATVQNEEQFDTLLNNFVSERGQVQNILEKNFGIDGLYTALCQNFGITPGQNEQEYLYQISDNSQLNDSALREACSVLAENGGKQDIERSIIIQEWLDLSQEEKVRAYSSYKFAYLKKTDGEILKNLAVKKIVQNYPKILETLETEAQRILSIEDDLKSIRTAFLTRDLFIVGSEILNQYDALKNDINALDFNDLILHTLNLLKGKTTNLNGLNVAPWIRFKLDQGIDHILVDEAQDTNPEQWEIIDALCDDFFQDEDENRTLFVVGDDKQSIFSFQRASPEKFYSMKKWFSQKIQESRKSFQPVDFNISFRSVPAVLDLVDSVFSDLDVSQFSKNQEIVHQSYRYKQEGLVELWPVFESEKKEEFDPWQAPLEISESSSGATKMAEHVGETIKKWLDQKEELKSYNRPIEAGDIMILVRSRTAFLDQLVRSLKTRNIPVTGVDRMILNDQLVVQDLCAAAQFALLPNDDLNLAGLLKSPFIGWGEERLYDITYDRKESLWAALKNSGHYSVIDWLKTLIPLSGRLKPYDFFSYVIQTPCPAHDISGLHAIKSRLGAECMDSIDEFLSSALDFENDSVPTLQSFIQSQQSNDNEIKRQLEEEGESVRIMTVHSAKGLQAPIVILPDTIRTSSSIKPERILWPDKSDADVPYFFPQSREVPQICTRAAENLSTQQTMEYRRLLYVALTRAEEKLYIGGYKAAKDPIDDSWYNYVERGFQKLEGVKTEETENGLLLRFTNPATDKPDREHKNKEKIEESIVIQPDWLFNPMPEEPYPPRPLMPSRPSNSDVVFISPLQGDNDYRFVRGNITHKLLEILPDIPADRRKSAAEKFINGYSDLISTKIQNGILNETMKVLDDPVFSKIFGAGSMAEVSVTGLVEDRNLVSGQIDRLLVTDTEVFIIDYKTNRPSPDSLKDVPEIYKDQMKSYRDIIRKIYPKHTIRTALIWTDGPTLMEIPDS